MFVWKGKSLNFHFDTLIQLDLPKVLHQIKQA